MPSSTASQPKCGTIKPHIVRSVHVTIYSGKKTVRAKVRRAGACNRSFEKKGRSTYADKERDVAMVSHSLDYQQSNYDCRLYGWHRCFDCQATVGRSKMNCPICGQPMVLMTTVFAEGGAEDVWACFNEHCQEGLDAE